MAEYTIFGADTPTLTGDVNDDDALTVGVGFNVTVPGWITHVRFYQGAVDDCSYHGIAIWDDVGTVLYNDDIINGLPDGQWNEVALSTPLAISAVGRYVAGVFHNGGSYAYTSAYFTGVPVGSDPLKTLGSNGLYKYQGGFPNNSFNATNYWVDVRFTDVDPNGGGGWDGSFVRLGGGGAKARVRLPNASAASVRLQDGSRL